MDHMSCRQKNSRRDGREKIKVCLRFRFTWRMLVVLVSSGTPSRLRWETSNHAFLRAVWLNYVIKKEKRAVESTFAGDEFG